jgi:hypothetical protein
LDWDEQVLVERKRAGPSRVGLIRRPTPNETLLRRHRRRRKRALAFDLLDRARHRDGEIGRVLRARHRQHAAENEERHAVDAGLLGLLGLLRDAIDIAIARQQVAGSTLVDSDPIYY